MPGRKAEIRRRPRILGIWRMAATTADAGLAGICGVFALGAGARSRALGSAAPGLVLNTQPAGRAGSRCHTRICAYRYCWRGVRSAISRSRASIASFAVDARVGARPTQTAHAPSYASGHPPTSTAMRDLRRRGSGRRRHRPDHAEVGTGFDKPTAESCECLGVINRVAHCWR
jgi:hypothetical protein